jgi:hypothetical protein
MLLAKVKLREVWQHGNMYELCRNRSKAAKKFIHASRKAWLQSQGSLHFLVAKVVIDNKLARQ